MVDNARNAIAKERNDPVLISDPFFLTDLAGWANRAGNLKQTVEYLGRTPQATRGDYDEDFLWNQTEFVKRPNQRRAWPGRVDDATTNAMAETFPFLQSQPGDGQDFLNSAEEKLRAAGYQIP